MVAKRSYPTSEIRGSGRECQAAMAQEWPRRRMAPSPRSVVAAERNYPVSKVRDSGREELPHIQGVVAARVQEGLERPSHIEGQEGRQ